jgi:hypothetical protein
MARAKAINATESSVAPEFGRKIRDARYLVGEDRFIVTFDSGKEYSFPRSSLEVDDGSEVVNIQVDRRRFFFRVRQASGNRYEIPWDRVLHEAEPSYRYFRGAESEQEQPARSGRRFESCAKPCHQEELAAPSEVRNNIFASGRSTVTLETLERIAKALKVSVAELIVPTR